MIHPIYPCLWFDHQAQTAAKFYCDIFPDSDIVSLSPVVVNFNLAGKKFMGLNGGPKFKINPSISAFVVSNNVDDIQSWCAQLSKDGSFLMPLDKYAWSQKYAWVKDKFGMTWQVMLGDPKVGHQIIPSLLFSNKQFGQAKSAIEFYTSLFPNSSIKNLQLYGDEDRQQKGNVMFTEFTLNDELFSAMDGPGDHSFAFNEGISFVVECDTQQEIDHYWNHLSKNGGEESRCGWLKDKFGISWQIVPTILKTLMGDPDKSAKVMDAFLKMKKFEIAKLIAASE